MAKRNPKTNSGTSWGQQKERFGGMEPNTQLDSHYVYPERERKGYVQSDADLEYGMVSGFRYGIESTGHRHKLSPLGHRVRGSSIDKG
ncbi:MAG: hypothetical protein WAN50_03385 [Minisyncoccia bacterium]